MTTLATLNALPHDEAVALLDGCCRWPGWAPALAGRRPFASLTDLRTAARLVLGELPDTELRTVLASYLPLGRPPAGATVSESFSRSEEAGLLGSDPSVVDAVIADGARYRERFGYPFVVAAAGRPGPELLAELRERLTHDAFHELAVARAQLEHKCGLRLAALIS